MSWIGGYLGNKPEHKREKVEAERQAKRDKLEADRLARAQTRAVNKSKLQAAQQSREEANKAFQELRDIAPDLFEYDAETVTEDIPEEVIDELLAEEKMEDFETENGTDGDKAMDKLGSVKCEFTKDDIAFWFTEFETQLEVIEVKSQWTKRIALQRFLPPEIKQEVKTLLMIPKAQGGADIYKRMKAELLDLF